MIVVTCHASVYTLVLMSLDRFLAVVHPISSISIRTQWNALLWVPQPLKEPKLISKTFFISTVPLSLHGWLWQYRRFRSAFRTAPSTTPITRAKLTQLVYFYQTKVLFRRRSNLAQPSLQILPFFSSLSPTGYNWAAFQVKTAEKKLIIRINTDIEITQSPWATSHFTSRFSRSRSSSHPTSSHWHWFPSSTWACWSGSGIPCPAVRFRRNRDVAKSESHGWWCLLC